MNFSILPRQPNDPPSGFLSFAPLTRFGNIALLASVTVIPAQPQTIDSTMLHVGQIKQYFFDDVIVESAQNITRRVHRPSRERKDPVIRKDRPWEHVTYFTVSSWRVIRDPLDDLFKCWYEDWMVRQTPIGSEPQVDPVRRRTRYLFARSRDGLSWEKPSLGVVRENGSDTNIVLGDTEFGSVHSGYVFLDPSEKRPDHRYKMLYNRRRPGLSRYEVASSPDGIHWQAWEVLPTIGWLGPHLEDVLTVSIDNYSGIYRLNVRHPRMTHIPPRAVEPYRPRFDPAQSDGPAGSFMPPVYPRDPARENRRRVFQAESSDFTRWTDLRPLLTPNPAYDNLDDAFYGMTQMPVGDAWVGFLHVLKMTENTMHVQLVFSRDGVNFQRIQPGVPWLEPEQGSWDGLMVNVYSPPVPVGDDLYVYYGGSNNHHDWWIEGRREKLNVPEATDLGLVNYSLGLLRMKADRFVSLTALAVREGLLVTRPFVAEGGRLVVNARCRPGGSVRVAVADGDGKVIPGFEAQHCEEFRGDDTAHAVRWKDGPMIPFNRKFIRLHFYLRDADLFSFQLKSE
jgi:hypothetical protein